MNERLEAKITGRVQLVMFRDFVMRKARALGLSGTVENMKDGSVFVVAEGNREKLEEVLVQLKKGSIFARVLSIEAKWLPASGAFKDFRILFYGGQD
jgi:acylphosphatase